MKRTILLPFFLFCSIAMGYLQGTRFSNIDFQIDYTEGFIKTANTYYALNETEVIDGSWKKTGKKIKKGETATVEGVIYTIDDYIVAGYKGNWISADDVAIKDSDILPNYLLRKNRYNEIIWIADWYKDVINLSRKEAIRFINKKLPVTEDLYFADSDTYWYEDYASYPFGIDFTNVLLNIRFLGRDGYNFLIKRIEKKNQDYIITCFPTEIYDWSDISAKCTDLENFPNPTETFSLRISPLKDSIKVYNFETKKLIVSLIPVSDKWVDLFQDFLKTGKKGNDMFVTHDTCNYEDENDIMTKPAVAPVSENAEPAEEEAVESERANEEASTAKEPSALPIMPIAAGGTVLVALLAVILLAVAKKRKAKKSRLKSASTNFCAAHFGK